MPRDASARSVASRKAGRRRSGTSSPRWSSIRISLTDSALGEHTTIASARTPFREKGPSVKATVVADVTVSAASLAMLSFALE